MARPKNKAQLIALSNANYSRLLEQVDSYSDEEQQKGFPAVTLIRNIRDVFDHLHQWHSFFLRWFKEGMQGENPDMPAKGYSWKSTPELNRAIQKKYNNTALNEIREELEKSFREIQHIISRHSNEQLFTRKKYKWTGSTSLGSYIVSATSSHYDWAFKLIERCKR